MNDTAPENLLEAVFSQAVDLPPAERAAFLEQACRGDGTLRAEVEGLLACDERTSRAGELLDKPLLQKCEPRATALAFDPPAAPGEVGMLGPYRIIKPKGEGGMGAVYAAVDTRLDRHVALKVMLPRFAADPAGKQRFLREARAAAQITHDNVVTIYEADEWQGITYIAMQLLGGCSLEDHLREKGSPALPEILRIAEEAAEGLAAAHQIGLIHRDIKPSNLWLEAPLGRVKVLDFGLARPLDGQADMTLNGAILGTPSYMSPEQARGQPLDHRTDLFSLGVVLYRMCGGRLPFEAPSTMAVLMALGTEDPPPLQELNPAVPAPLAGLIHQMLAKQPNARPQSAAEVAKRVRALSEGLAPAGPVIPPRSAAHESRSRRRRFAPAAVALLVVIAVAAILIVRNWNGSETTANAAGEATPPPADNTKVIRSIATPTPSAIDDDNERKAAEWVLSMGGIVRLGNDDHDTTAIAALPKERFTLSAVVLSGTATTDAALVNLGELKALLSLRLDHTNVTDAGLAQIKRFKTLKNLMIGPGISDKGLVHLDGMTSLRRIFIERANQITNKGLARIKGLRDLSQLSIIGAKVNDDGLVHLQGLTQLKALDVRNTRVTQKGVESFHAAVPTCTVEHNGGTLAGINQKPAAAVHDDPD